MQSLIFYKIIAYKSFFLSAILSLSKLIKYNIIFIKNLLHIKNEKEKNEQNRPSKPR